MASILPFVVRTDRARRRASAENKLSGACEIIIFPGVRYERWGEDGAKPTPQKKRSRKRRARSR